MFFFFLLLHVHDYSVVLRSRPLNSRSIDYVRNRFFFPQGRERGKYLGCFQDSPARFLNASSATLNLENSPEACVDYCRLAGYSFAGVQYG
jgi:hypothetical protein